MKKILLIFFSIILILTGCSENTETPITVVPSTATPAPQNNTIDGKYPDKINETTYAGELTEITETTITIIMDKKDSVTFDLNDRAKRDIEILKIEVGNRIIVTFDDPETKNITSVQKIQSEL